MSKVGQYLRSVEPQPGESPREAAEVCARLIRWLANLDLSQKTLSRRDVALLLEAASIIHLNIIAFGSDLNRELFQRWEDSDAHLKTFYQTLLRPNPIVCIAEKVLQLNHCEEHLPAVRGTFSSFLSLRRFEETVERIALKQFDSADEPQTVVSETNLEAVALLNRIFRLKNEHIPEAIERLATLQCTGIKFEHIALILMDPPNSITYKKSLIFQKYLSKRLDDGQISSQFISSIAEECSADEENLWLLFRCLKASGHFAASLTRFLIKFLCNCNCDDTGKNFYSQEFRGFNIENIFIIVGILLSNRSPMKMNLFRELFLSVSKIDWRLRKLLKKQYFLYDY